MSNKEFYEQTGFAMTCRSYEEYLKMFACDPESDPSARLLDVAGGASSFAVGARRKGLSAVSADPLFSREPEAMAKYGEQELEEAVGKLANLIHKFDWSYYGSHEEHTRRRRESLKLFLEDYTYRYGTEAYVPASLPNLPFANDSFTHVFCSHFLFLYAEQLSYEFHLEALLELARVCKPGGQIRVYPLLDLKNRAYDRLDELLESLRARGLGVELPDSGLPFIPGSKRLLCINKPE